MQFLTRVAPCAAAMAVAAGALMASQPAAAECSCMCLDGSYRTVCTSPEEVRANLGICDARAVDGCPSDPEDIERESYEAPMDGVGNCRTAQAYDARADEFLATKVCDVAPPEPSAD